MYNPRFQYQFLIGKGRIFGDQGDELFVFLLLFFIFLSRIKQTIKSIFSHHEKYDLRYIFLQNNLLCEWKQNWNWKQRWFSVKGILSWSYFQHVILKKPQNCLSSAISKSVTLPNIYRLFFPGLFLYSRVKFQLFLRLSPL